VKLAHCNNEDSACQGRVHANKLEIEIPNAKRCDFMPSLDPTHTSSRDQCQCSSIDVKICILHHAFSLWPTAEFKFTRFRFHCLHFALMYQLLAISSPILINITIIIISIIAIRYCFRHVTSPTMGSTLNPITRQIFCDCLLMRISSNFWWLLGAWFFGATPKLRGDCKL